MPVFSLSLFAPSFAGVMIACSPPVVWPSAPTVFPSLVPPSLSSSSSSPFLPSPPSRSSPFAPTVPMDGLNSNCLSYRIGSAESLIAAADRLFELGYWDDAESRYSYAIALFPSGINYCCRAFFYLETTERRSQDRSQDALRDARSALTHDPGLGLAHFVIAKSLIREGRFEEARTILSDLKTCASMDEKSVAAVRIEERGLDLMQDLVSKVNQSFLKQDWVSVYHFAVLTLAFAPRLKTLIEMRDRSLAHLEKDPSFRKKRDIMLRVRQALDYMMTTGQDYEHLLCIKSLSFGSRLRAVDLTDEEVKNGYSMAFTQFLSLDTSDDFESMEETVEFQLLNRAYDFLLNPVCRALYADWKHVPDLFDPNDLFCFTVSDTTSSG